MRRHNPNKYLKHNIKSISEFQSEYNEERKDNWGIG
jgi:hypothetical protein